MVYLDDQYPAMVDPKNQELGTPFFPYLNTFCHCFRAVVLWSSLLLLTEPYLFRAAPDIIRFSGACSCHPFSQLHARVKGNRLGRKPCNKRYLGSRPSCEIDFVLCLLGAVVRSSRDFSPPSASKTLQTQNPSPVRSGPLSPYIIG